MKALVLAVTLVGTAAQPLSAGQVDSVRLTMNSTRYCVGANWSLTLSNAAANAAIRLNGVVNGIPWEIPYWADTDTSGNFRANGTYAGDVAAKYTLRAEIMGSTSNTLTVEIVNCGWRATASPGTARAFGQTATPLANGKVLVVGGGLASCFPECVATSSAELYDPATGQWSDTGSMATPRFGHIAVRLANGRVLVAGGYMHSSATSVNSAEISAEIYDPDSGIWNAAGSLRVPRLGHAATLLTDGRVLVTGGTSTRSEFLDTAELYDPATNVWSAAGRMIGPRQYHTTLLLPGGKVLVFGGLGGFGAFFYGFPLHSAELYDPATGSWTATGTLVNGRVLHAATLLHNGKVLVAGGERDDIGFDHYGTAMDKAELYDPSTGQWSPTGSLNEPREEHTMTLLPDGRVLAAGGTCELYDPLTASWSISGTLTPGSGGGTATLLADGRVLAVGGNRAGLYDAGVETPGFTMNSTSYCIGDRWNSVVTHPALEASIRLLGVSNGTSWEIPQWGSIDTDGSFKSSGTFDDGAKGTHTLHVEIGNVWSSDLSFVVSSCK